MRPNQRPDRGKDLASWGTSPPHRVSEGAGEAPPRHALAKLKDETTPLVQSEVGILVGLLETPVCLVVELWLLRALEVQELGLAEAFGWGLAGPIVESNCSTVHEGGSTPVGDRLLPVCEQKAVEELTTVVGMALQNGEGQPGQDALEGILPQGHRDGAHDGATVAKDGNPFAPAGGHVDQLERVDVLPGGGIPRIMDQVGFEMAGLWELPGQAASGDRPDQGVGRRRAGVSPSDPPWRA